MKSLVILLAVLDDAQKATCADTSRDKITILSRHEHEGDSFLGITLPDFGSWFERSLELNRAETTIYSKFRKVSGRRSVLPCFLHGLTSLVFDPKSGHILNDCDVNAVFFIRQICYLLKKEKKLCSPKKVVNAFDSFLETEDSLRKTLPKNAVDRWYFDRVTSFYGSALESVYPSTISELPRHGPGATSDSLRYNRKFMTRKFFGSWRNAFSIEEIYGFQAVDIENSSFEPAVPVKVIAVPKTMKTARIIAVEDTAMQFAQQYVSSRFYSSLSKIGLTKNLNPNDQSVNQHYARLGSVDRSFSTLDLSEASDRLTAKLVHHALRSAPVLRRQVFAVRTPYARVQLKTIVLKKFASMGSAVTFPIESFTFFCIAISAVLKWFDLSGQHPRSSFLSRLREAERLVFVFGDDIIVPNDASSLAMHLLETYGLKVNRNKSFFNGWFRESCGLDAFKGYDVTPVYLRTRTPHSIADAAEFASYVSTGNLFHRKGLFCAAATIRSIIDNIYKLPLVSDRSSVLGWYTFQNVRTYDRTDKYGNNVVRSLRVSSRRIHDPLDGDSALLKFFTSKEIYDDPDHLIKSTEKYSLRLRRTTGVP